MIFLTGFLAMTARAQEASPAMADTLRSQGKIYVVVAVIAAIILITKSCDIGAYFTVSGAPAFTIQAVGELASSPFLRDDARPTEPRLIAMSREGALQGFAPRVEPPPVPLTELPGAKVGG